MKSVIVITLLSSLFIGGNFYEHNYILNNCEVKCITNNETIFEDETGELWKIEKNNNFKYGEKVDLIMNDNCTINTVKDDKILYIKKN